MTRAVHAGVMDRTSKLTMSGDARTAQSESCDACSVGVNPGPYHDSPMPATTTPSIAVCYKGRCDRCFALLPSLPQSATACPSLCSTVAWANPQPAPPFVQRMEDPTFKPNMGHYTVCGGAYEGQVCVQAAIWSRWFQPPWPPQSQCPSLEKPGTPMSCESIMGSRPRNAAWPEKKKAMIDDQFQANYPLSLH